MVKLLLLFTVEKEKYGKVLFSVYWDQTFSCRVMKNSGRQLLFSADMKTLLSGIFTHHCIFQHIRLASGQRLSLKSNFQKQGASITGSVMTKSKSKSILIVVRGRQNWLKYRFSMISQLFYGSDLSDDVKLSEMTTVNRLCDEVMEVWSEARAGGGKKMTTDSYSIYLQEHVAFN